MLKRINDALPELILGILIYEIVVEFTGIWFVKDKLGYSIGLLIGAATAIGMAVHMAVVLRDSMDMAEAEGQDGLHYSMYCAISWLWQSFLLRHTLK